MNDETPAPIERLTAPQQIKANMMALDRLRIEITGRPLDPAAIRASVSAQNASRDWRDPLQDAAATLRQRRGTAASRDWAGLDRLALIRAAIWIAHADAYGQGVTFGEIEALRRTSDPDGIAVAARSIVLRLSQVVVAPDADALAVARSDVLSEIIPEDRPA